MFQNFCPSVLQSIASYKDFTFFQDKLSPLDQAIKLERYDILKVLLAKGARVSIDALKEAIVRDNKYVYKNALWP